MAQTWSGVGGGGGRETKEVREMEEEKETEQEQLEGEGEREVMGKVVAEQKEGTQERDGQKGVVGWGERRPSL